MPRGFSSGFVIASGVSFIYLLLIACRARCQEPVAGNEAHLCRFTNVKTSTVLRKNVTTTTEYHTKSCGLPSDPSLQCPETKVLSRVYWYPVQKKDHLKIVKCCPGWTDYVINVGCTRKIGCGISLPQKDSSSCKMIRLRRLMYYRSFYRLTTPVKPDDPKRTKVDLIFPTLNQTTLDVMTRTMMDPFTAHWFNVYFHGMLLRNNKTLNLATRLFSHLKYFSSADYIQLYEFFIPLQEKTGMPYFKLPSNQPGFTKIVYNETWKSDTIFVEQRLAGLNPMSLQKVTEDGSVGMGWSHLFSKLNRTFDWNGALSAAMGYPETMASAVKEGVLFVVDYPIYNDIPHTFDITDEDPTDDRVMMNSTSPIGIFASTKNAKGQTELKIVAIQLDYKPASEVRTPKDGVRWMVAKALFQMADFAVVEIYEHLLRTHVRIEPFCVGIHRHFPSTHPLYLILKIHCRGLLPTNSYGFPKLTSEMMYMHRLFGMGHIGTMKLLNDGFQSMTWKDNDLLINIKARGLDDNKTLPYFPYRDDGKVIYAVLESFSTDVVDLYYKSNEDVAADYELQSYMNELSDKGIGSPDAAMGKVAGLPSKLETKEGLADLIKELIWIVVQHASVNYPVTAYGVFPPNSPTKLYQEPGNRDYSNYYQMLPKSYLPILQNFVTLNLGTMRYDVLFDYSGELKDTKGKYLVKGYYDKMMTQVQPLLEERNKQRYAQGHLTYQYLEPKWLPNSIHT